jgi:acyl-coenzyme A synthetase/AMP-(fatty) acid ligase
MQTKRSACSNRAKASTSLPAAAPSDSILKAWAHVLAARGSDAAVLSSAGKRLRTFAEIETEAGEWHARFAQLPARSVVAVQIGNSPQWPAVFLALLRTGHITLPLGSDSALPVHIANAFIDSALKLRCLHPAESESCRASLPAATTLLKLTSGTTAEPRAIRFTSAQLAADCDQICATMGIRPQDVNYGAIPIAHSYGFSNLLTPLLVQGTRLVLTEDRVPRAMVEGMRATAATVFPGTPVLIQHLAQLEAEKPEHLRLCISAGAPLKPAVWEAFRRRFGLNIHVFYGSSECGGIAYSANGSFPEDGFVGQPMNGVAIAPLQDGRIEVRSPAVGDGYFPHEEPEVLGGGRFIPGDLVRASSSGFVLVGRASDFINVAGRKLNPSEVERRLCEFPGVESAVVFGVPSPLRGEEPVACVAGMRSTRWHSCATAIMSCLRGRLRGMFGLSRPSQSTRGGRLAGVDWRRFT